MQARKMSKAADFPLSSKDLPATQGMLKLVRKEVQSDIRALEYKMDSRFKQVDARFNQVDAKINELASHMSLMASQMSKMEATMNRMDIRNEEQNSRNQIVLEALVAQTQRTDRIEVRLTDVESVVRSLAVGRQPKQN